jgi:predicted DNA-binding antitoxin AbrB/MazE fold protein
MTEAIEALYQGGVLKLPKPLSVPENSRVWVTVETESEPSADSERAGWMTFSKEALLKTWDNSADDVFNELLDK